MSEEKKSNQDKFRKNAKYKNYAKTASKTAPKSAPKDTKLKNSGIAVTNIDSNWDRYQEIQDEESNETLTFERNYKTISEAPISQGTYFQMKKDKHFNSDTDSQFDSSGPFEMNLEQICLGIMSIPFYERFGIQKDLLNDNYISSMDVAAEENLKFYEEYLKEKENPKRAPFADPVVTIDNGIVNIEEVINEPEKPRKTVAKSKAVEELEEWLDDILD